MEIIKFEDLKKGDFFGIEAICLGFFTTIVQNNEKEFNAKINVNYIHNEILSDKYLIFMYLGNNKCIELYTKSIVVLTNEQEFFSNLHSYMTRLKEIKQNPLCINIDNTYLYSVDECFKQTFTESNIDHTKRVEKSEKEIIDAIKKLERHGEDRLEISEINGREYDYRLAYVENLMYPYIKENIENSKKNKQKSIQPLK